MGKHSRAPREAVLDAAGDAQSRTFAVGSDEGEARWWFGGLATIKATKEQTGGHYTLVEVLEPEGEGPLHVHYREDEGFWVLAGQLTFEVGEETIKAGPDSFVFGPKYVPRPSATSEGPEVLPVLTSHHALSTSRAPHLFILLFPPSPCFLSHTFSQNLTNPTMAQVSSISKVFVVVGF
jgi:mannose-6-phosphate isomerase-like protein (cupin superfamily)